MGSEDTSSEQTLNFSRILTSSTCDGTIKLHSTQKLKNYFSLPEKTLTNIKLKYLLKEGGVLLKSNSQRQDFLISYGTSLINYVGKDISLDLELFSQIEYIFVELQQQNENLVDKLYIKICQLQSDSFLCFSGILKIFKPNFERTLLDWIENNSNLNMEFLAKLSANSPKLFQTITSILHSIIVKTFGHWKIFDVTTTFISLVVSACMKNGKDFLVLYPANCRRIVSLLLVSPGLYSDEIIQNEVLVLLMEMFLLDKKQTLILLSHYSDWLSVFRNFLLKKNTPKMEGF